MIFVKNSIVSLVFHKILDRIDGKYKKKKFEHVKRIFSFNVVLDIFSIFLILNFVFG